MTRLDDRLVFNNFVFFILSIFLVYVRGEKNLELDRRRLAAVIVKQYHPSGPYTDIITVRVTVVIAVAESLRLPDDRLDSSRLPASGRMLDFIGGMADH
ncbi:hypothetical protein FEI13_08475 [Halomonas urmiana]|uniref:Uncharacterized protein n=1 Tax=Halomonas urmiana TaxID=490901 RepID=A0A5R8MHL2_9GAMM|nr:hypothetical protein [Halomonas urmiana]TLF50707.1 hypothetical protein FEI13_08475 [Halomonas urmiana]